MSGRGATLGLLVLIALGVAGCEAAPRNERAVGSYYRYDFTAAREAVRRDAMERNDEQAVLNTMRLGLAAMADGDLDESEAAFGRAFDLLGTAGLNADRTTAAVLLYEGVRIWKGEPFEQALAYYDIATLYAVRGDWENARAAAANALFRLKDFGEDRTPEELVRRATLDPDYLDAGYEAVPTDFALGYLMQAIASDASGAPGSREQLDAALAIDPRLAPLVETLRSRAFDTLLIVEYGKGPAKVAYGPDDALVRFVARDRFIAPIEVSVNGGAEMRFDPVCDVNRMAQDHRWNNLEDIRRAKSAIGDLLVTGGMITVMTSGGAGDRNARLTQGLIGGGLMGIGMLLKAGAQADTRYLELAPRSIYLVPLRLGVAADLTVTVNDRTPAVAVLPDVAPGRPARPRAVYLRLLDGRAPPPPWLRATGTIYGNDETGVRPGDFPWLLGGADVSTPTRATLAAYQAGGHLRDMTLEGLRALYEAEGIVIGSGGGDARSARDRDASYRHVLEGGEGLFTPAPDSLGYKRLMCAAHPPYSPKSALVRNAARRIGSNTTTDLVRLDPPVTENDR